MTRRLVLAALAAAVLAACTAGYPPPPGGVRAIAHEAPHVALLGDSITNQMFWALDGPGPGAPADLETYAGLGWHEATPALPLAVANEVATDDLDILVIALAVNGSADGWTAADVEAWRALLAPVPDDVCIRILLPNVRAPGITAERSRYLAATRAGILGVMGDRPRVTYVDWQAAVDAATDRGVRVLAPDGIHLLDNPDTGEVNRAAALVRARALWTELDRCGAVGRAA